MASTGCEPFSDSDVLTGRDRLALTHPGNMYYRELCRSYKRLYNVATRRSEKSDAINSIVGAVKRRGGRFMTLDDENGDGTADWIEMDEDSVHKKVSHNLRHRSARRAQEGRGANRQGRDNGRDSPTSSASASSRSRAKEAASLRFSTKERLTSSSMHASNTLEANSRRPSLHAMAAFDPLSSTRATSLHAVGSLAPRRHDATGQLYLFDAPFRETFIRQVMDSSYQMCAVSYHVVRGSTTEIHGANLVMLKPHQLRY